MQENELQLLAEIPEDDTCVAFGKYVLLGNKEAASKKFDALSKDKRKLYRTYPIYHLFGKQINHLLCGWLKLLQLTV